jgi:hypothetical protein
MLFDHHFGELLHLIALGPFLGELRQGYFRLIG